MKPTKPVLKRDYVPSWKQGDGYLKRKFAKIAKQQREEQTASDEEVRLKVRRLK